MPPGWSTAVNYLQLVIEKHTYSFMLSDFATKWGRLDVSSNPWNKAVDASFWNFPSAIWVGTPTNSFEFYYLTMLWTTNASRRFHLFDHVQVKMRTYTIIPTFWAQCERVFVTRINQPTNYQCLVPREATICHSACRPSRLELGLELLNHF